MLDHPHQKLCQSVGNFHVYLDEEKKQLYHSLFSEDVEKK